MILLTIKKTLQACTLLVSFLLGGIFLALGQDQGPTQEVWIDPDRPHVADSSVNVPQGYYLQENGFQLTYRGHNRDFDLPETLIRLGIGKRTELRFNVPNYFTSRADAGPTVDGRRNMDWQNSILLDRRWGKKTEVFVEYASDVFQRGPSSHIIHLGGAYRPARNHQFDVRVGFGLSPAAPRVFFGVGYSFLLGKSN